jgi:hypothetical protein
MKAKEFGVLNNEEQNCEDSLVSAIMNLLSSHMKTELKARINL